MYQLLTLDQVQAVFPKETSLKWYVGPTELLLLGVKAFQIRKMLKLNLLPLDIRQTRIQGIGILPADISHLFKHGTFRWNEDGRMIGFTTPGKVGKFTYGKDKVTYTTTQNYVDHETGEDKQWVDTTVMVPDSLTIDNAGEGGVIHMVNEGIMSIVTVMGTPDVDASGMVSVGKVVYEHFTSRNAVFTIPRIAKAYTGHIDKDGIQFNNIVQTWSDDYGWQNYKVWATPVPYTTDASGVELHLFVANLPQEDDAENWQLLATMDTKPIEGGFRIFSTKVTEKTPENKTSFVSYEYSNNDLELFVGEKAGDGVRTIIRVDPVTFNTRWCKDLEIKADALYEKWANMNAKANGLV